MRVYQFESDDGITTDVFASNAENVNFLQMRTIPVGDDELKLRANND